MAKVMLTENWRWYKAREIIDVTPGQKTLLITLCKGIEYIEPEPVIEETEPIVEVIVKEPEVVDLIIEEPEVVEPVIKKAKRKYTPRKTKRKGGKR